MFIEKEELDIGENKHIVIHHVLCLDKKMRSINQPCSICLEDMDHKKEFIFVLEKCRHAFHKKCLYQWLCMDKHDCPLCRAPLYNKYKYF